MAGMNMYVTKIDCKSSATEEDNFSEIYEIVHILH